MGNALLRSNTPRINQQWLMKRDVQYTQDYFEYPILLSASLTALATAAAVSLTIQSDSHFEWVCTKAFGWPGTNPASINTLYADNVMIPITLQITDGGSGRQLFNTPAPLTSIAGLGREPYYLPIPRIFLAKSQVSFQAISIDPAQTWTNVYIILGGRKVFESPIGNPFGG